MLRLEVLRRVANGRGLHQAGIDGDLVGRDGQLLDRRCRAQDRHVDCRLDRSLGDAGFLLRGLRRRGGNQFRTGDGQDGATEDREAADLEEVAAVEVAKHDVAERAVGSRIVFDQLRERRFICRHSFAVGLLALAGEAAKFVG